MSTPDCQTCGLCCVTLDDQEVWCDVTPEDEKRLPKKFVRLNVLKPTTAHQLAAALHGHELPYAAIKSKWTKQTSGSLKGVSACACVALQGNLLHKVRCKVYKTRPQACRDAMQPGDDACLELRGLWLDAAERLGTAK